MMVVQLIPLTQKAARQFVDEHHRHLAYPVSDVIRVGLKFNGDLVAVGVAGRPVARMLDDGATLEITRLASIAEPITNASTRLYGALRQAGISLGYTRFVTYTRMDEAGRSVKAAGFQDCGLTQGGEWDCRSRPRRSAAQPIQKRRWMWLCKNREAH